MSILRISDYTRPAAERWRGGVVFGSGGGREAAEPPGTNKLRADGSPAEEGGRAGGGRRQSRRRGGDGVGNFGKYVVEQVLEFMC